MSIDTIDIKEVGDVMRDASMIMAESLQGFILWARENDIVLSRVKFADVEVELTDPTVTLAALGIPGRPGDDREDRSDPPPMSYYEQYARSVGIRRGVDDDE